MSFEERMASMMNSEILSVAIHAEQRGEGLGTAGRLERDQLIWNSEGILTDDNYRPNGAKTFQKAYFDLKIAKGSATEEAICYSLRDRFSSIDTQMKINLEGDNYTKSDIIAINANSDMQVGSNFLRKGESIGIEVKCGDVAYLTSQILHIDKQLSGFDKFASQYIGSKFHKTVMLTADYMFMSESSKQRLNSVVKNHNASISILPFFACDMTQVLAKIER